MIAVGFQTLMEPLLQHIFLFTFQAVNVPDTVRCMQ